MDDADKKSTKALVLFLVGIAVVIILIMLVPKIHSPFKETTSYSYNYFDFQEIDGVWMTQVEVNGQLLQVALRNSPRDVEDVAVIGDISGFMDADSFTYITFDPREENHDEYVTMSNAEISPNLVVHFGKDITAACTVNDPVCNDSDVPIITCNNTDRGVIFLDRAPGPTIEINGNCAVITGMGPDMVRAADRFMYGAYGIMK